MAAVGDVQLGMAWPPGHVVLPPDDAKDMFDGVKGALADADVHFGNLETVLADAGDSKKCGKKSTKCYAFRVPTSFAEALRLAGFDVMSIANNHAGDFGPEGRKSTMAALDAASIRHSGPLGDIASWDVGGRRVALVGFSFGSDVYRIQDLVVARKLVADLKKRHDLVFVSFHGGAEGVGAARVPQGVETFLGENRGDVRAFAHTVVDAGADLVLGSSPHLLRALELYKGRLIAYSLGNFSTWDTFNLTGPLGISGILKVSLAPNGVATRVELVPALLAKPGRPVLDSLPPGRLPRPEPLHLGLWRAALGRGRRVDVFPGARPGHAGPVAPYTTASGGSRPPRTASTLSSARKPMAVRVSRVAVPKWGRRKTLGSMP